MTIEDCLKLLLVKGCTDLQLQFFDIVYPRDSSIYYVKVVRVLVVSSPFSKEASSVSSLSPSTCPFPLFWVYPCVSTRNRNDHIYTPTRVILSGADTQDSHVLSTI